MDESTNSMPVESEVKPVPEVKPEVRPEVKPEVKAVKTEAVESSISQELEELRTQINRLAVSNLLSDRKVPEKLHGLIPQDLNKAIQFIESEEYKNLVAELDRLSELERQKAELQAKIEALNHPQKVETTPVPDEKTEPAKKVPAKTWGDITSEDLASIGSVLLNQL